MTADDLPPNLRQALKRYADAHFAAGEWDDAFDLTWDIIFQECQDAEHALVELLLPLLNR